MPYAIQRVFMGRNVPDFQTGGKPWCEAGNRVDLPLAHDFTKDSPLLPFGVGIWFLRQRFESRTVYLLEQGVPACPEMPGDAVIELDDAVPDHGVQFVQREEALVAKPGDNPAFSQLNTNLDFYLNERLPRCISDRDQTSGAHDKRLLVARFVRPGQHHDRILMCGKIGIGAIDCRFIETRLGVAEQLAVCIDDQRVQSQVVHDLAEIIRSAC